MHGHGLSGEGEEGGGVPEDGWRFVSGAGDMHGREKGGFVWISVGFVVVVDREFGFDVRGLGEVEGGGMRANVVVCGGQQEVA